MQLPNTLSKIGSLFTNCLKLRKNNQLSEAQKLPKLSAIYLWLSPPRSGNDQVDKQNTMVPFSCSIISLSHHKTQNDMTDNVSLGGFHYSVLHVLSDYN